MIRNSFPIYPKEKSHILVPWSGGLDSTYLIYHYLHSGHRVTAYKVDLTNNADQTRSEKHAIKCHVAYFKDHGFSDTFQYKGPTIEVSVNARGGLTPALQQVPLWLMGALYLPASQKDFDYIAFAYVMNDDAISFLNEIKAIYDSYEIFTAHWEKRPELIFPLSKIDKSLMIGAMPKELLKNVSWCEVPDKEMYGCGTCASCVRQRKLQEEYPNIEFFKAFQGDYISDATDSPFIEKDYVDMSEDEQIECLDEGCEDATNAIEKFIETELETTEADDGQHDQNSSERRLARDKPNTQPVNLLQKAKKMTLQIE